MCLRQTAVPINFGYGYPKINTGIKYRYSNYCYKISILIVSIYFDYRCRSLVLGEANNQVPVDTI